MIAKLHIQVAEREGVSYLRESFFTPPFKIANITEDKRSNTLHLMLMNSSPGILDEDLYNFKVEVKPGAFLHLHTQSYQRVFNMKIGARQSVEIILEENSSFIHLPHPSVPHQNSILTCRNEIFMKEGSRLIWGEILTCGRRWSNEISSNGGEIFSFTKYHSSTDIIKDGRLIIRENLLMVPGLINPRGLGQLEEYTHQASLIVVGRESDQDEMHRYFSTHDDILAGISTTSGNGTVVRILGHGAEQLYHHLQAIAFLIQHQNKQQSVKNAYAE